MAYHRAVPQEIQPRNRAAWRRWLERNHASSPAVWLIVRKKGSRAEGVTHEEALEEALCFGWIDSKMNPIDADRYRVWLAPRKPRSIWSAANKRRVAELTRAGRMAEAGRAAVRVAKRNGLWNALEAVDSLLVPADLARALRAEPGAKRHFEAFPPSSRKIILEWIGTAKRPETRAKRIGETVRLAALNVRAPQGRQ